MITVVGVGIEKGDVTERGRAAISRAKRVFSRVKLDFPTEILCEKFASAEDYAALDGLIAAEVAAADGAVYCALGDGFTDTAVKAIAALTDVTIIPGPSEYRGRRPDSSVAVISAYDLAARRATDTAMPLVVYGIDDALIAGRVKAALTDLYGDEAEVTFSSKGRSALIKLYELDRQKSYVSAAVAIEGMGELADKKRYVYSDLLAVMDRLTAPGGCPWDRAQTHESIRINLIEEAYEAADAIDKGDLDNLREEVGDVLLQAVFHANIAERTGEFTLNDVIDELVRKLVTRHTHIFGANRAADEAAALGFWEQAKAEEKHAATLCEQLDRLPAAFPSLLRGAKAYKKAVKAGMKVDSEMISGKLKSLLSESGAGATAAGEILFLACVYAVMLGADPEAELSRRAAEFIRDAQEADAAGKVDTLAEKL